MQRSAQLARDKCNTERVPGYVTAGMLHRIQTLIHMKIKDNEISLVKQSVVG